MLYMINDGMQEMHLSYSNAQNHMFETLLAACFSNRDNKIWFSGRDNVKLPYTYVPDLNTINI